MSRNVDLRNSVDTTARQNHPDQPYGGSPYYYIWDEGFAYSYFSMPFPPGATIISAILYYYNADAISGNKGLIARRINGSWATNTLTWNNRPVAGAVVGASVGHNNAGSLTEWAIDVTAYIQEVANGGLYNGFRIESTANNNETAFYSSRGFSVPQMVITWAERPSPPSDLNPRGDGVVATNRPYFTWNFVDSEGASTMHSYQIQVSPSGSFTDNVLDYNGVWPVPAADGNAIPGWPGLAPHAYYWWRVANQDNDGLWSDWSAPVRFVYTPIGILTVTSPTVTDDSTPTFTWTLKDPNPATADPVQTMFQVRVFNQTEGGNQVFDSGRIASNAKSYTLPIGILKLSDETWRVQVDAWDDQARIATPGVPNYSTGIQDFEWVRTSSVLGVTNLDFYSVYEIEPYVGLQWNYDGDVEDPDYYFTIWRDGVQVGQVTQAQSRVGTSNLFQFRDLFVPARIPHTWQIIVHASGKASLDNQTLEKSIKITTPWLISAVDNSKMIPIVNASVDPGLYEINDLAIPLSGNPVLVSQSLKGFLGTCEGVIASGVSDILPDAYEGKLRMLFMRKNPRVYFLWADQAIECYIYNVAIISQPQPNGKTDYSVSFSFAQSQGTL